MADELYVLGSGGGEDDSDGWVSPRPIDEALIETVTAETDLAAEDLAGIKEYVDTEEIAAVLNGEGDGSLAFEIEGHRVEVDASGQVDVETA